LEILVATALMAIAVVGMLSGLTTSLRNASSLTIRDRAAIVAKRKLDELLLARRLPRFTPIQGQLSPLTDAGLAGGWTATISPFDVPPAIQPGIAILERVECEIWWMDGNRRRTFKLEGYKRSILQPTDVIGGVIQP